MNLLRSIETRIATVVEGAFGRVFKTNVQPVELARRLTLEMDGHQMPSVRNVYVPNVYDVYLSPDDHAQFREIEPGLISELAEYLAEWARQHGYSLFTRPRVSFHIDPDLEVGAFGIASSTDRPDEESVAAQVEPAGATMVQPAAKPAVVPLRIVSSDGSFALTESRATLGRGRNNDVVLHDSSVSREHAEMVRDDNGWLVRDLDSTNGVLVNGSRVKERHIAAGDRILLGNAELQVEAAPGGDSP